MTTYGPGDPATWPTSTTHSNDPRNDDEYTTCVGCGQEAPIIDVIDEYDGSGYFSVVVVDCGVCHPHEE